MSKLIQKINRGLLFRTEVLKPYAVEARIQRRRGVVRSVSDACEVVFERLS